LSGVIIHPSIYIMIINIIFSLKYIETYSASFPQFGNFLRYYFFSNICLILKKIKLKRS